MVKKEEKRQRERGNYFCLPTLLYIIIIFELFTLYAGCTFERVYEIRVTMQDLKTQETKEDRKLLANVDKISK